MVANDFPGPIVLETSLTTGEGLDQLEASIAELVFSGAVEGEGSSALFLEAKHSELLTGVILSLGDAVETLRQKYPLDIVSIDLRQAQQQLGNLLGEDTSEAVLDNIFQRFCIGK